MLKMFVLQQNCGLRHQFYSFIFEYRSFSVVNFSSSFKANKILFSLILSHHLNGYQETVKF